MINDWDNFLALNKIDYRIDFYNRIVGLNSNYSVIEYWFHIPNLNSATKLYPSSAAISFSSNSNSPSSVYITLLVAAVSFVTSRRCRLDPGLVAVSSPPDSVAIRRFSSRPHHLFNMADVDCIQTFVRIHYPTGRRHLIRHQPSPVSFLETAGTVGLCRRLVVTTISSTFFSKVKSAITKFRNARQTKMTDVNSNIQHRHVTFKYHCT